MEEILAILGVFGVFGLSWLVGSRLSGRRVGNTGDIDKDIERRERTAGDLVRAGEERAQRNATEGERSRERSVDAERAIERSKQASEDAFDIIEKVEARRHRKHSSDGDADNQ